MLNNKDEYLEKNSMTISELLECKSFTFKMLIIKLNGRLIRKHEYDSTIVNDGDEIIVLHLVSGG